MAHTFPYCSRGPQGKGTEERQGTPQLQCNCTHLTRWQSNVHSSPSQYVNHELPDVQTGFRKGREETEIKLPTPVGSLKKQDSSRKTSISALLTMPKPLTV